jgi:ribosomal-protein-alanine N-acetyltransferase
MSDPDVAYFTTWEAHTDLDHTRRVIASWISEYSRGSMDWCIVHRSNNMPIGSITAVRDHPDKGWCEIGYCLSQDYWDMGIMTEALRAVVRFIFDNTGYEWIQARHEVENEASGRVMEKSGFRHVGTYDLVNPKSGRTVPYRFMMIRRSDVPCRQF